MASVREVTFELFRKHGMTTIFGNPGSTELPMLAEFPDDFRYVLGLQEAVAVGMADGYAQASGGPAHVNLHTAPGVGNGMGAIFNAQANHSPLVVTAGQQVRAHITMQANLTNRDATRVVHPFVKWSFEPPRAQDVPHALARAIHTASLAPKGPAFVSLPMDDWNAEAEEASGAVVERTSEPRSGPDPDAIEELAKRLEAANNPVLVAGPDIDASGRLGRRDRPGRAPEAAGVRLARAGRRAPRLPGGPPALPGRPAAGDRPRRRDAQGPRPDPRDRLLGLPVLPLHPRPAPPRGRLASSRSPATPTRPPAPRWAT